MCGQLASHVLQLLLLLLQMLCVAAHALHLQPLNSSAGCLPAWSCMHNMRAVLAAALRVWRALLQLQRAACGAPSHHCHRDTAISLRRHTHTRTHTCLHKERQFLAQSMCCMLQHT